MTNDETKPETSGTLVRRLYESRVQMASAGQVQRNTLNSRPERIFLLSPANAAGTRARLVLRDGAPSTLAARLRQQGLPLGELFSFISGLYFRGKLVYAQAFGEDTPSLPGALVITPCWGLVPPDTIVNLDEFREMLAVPVEPTDARYRVPLERDARMLFDLAGKGCESVLLGSIATPKYVEPLLGIFGQQLVFPVEFVGRGDMSRGGLLLRCARAREQLNYVPVATAVRHGPRPPKLPRLAETYREPGRTRPD